MSTISSAMGFPQVGAAAPRRSPKRAALDANAPAGGSFAMPGGVKPIGSPSFKPYTPGTMTPLNMINNLQGYQNQANQANDARYTQGLGVLGGTRNDVNALYGSAQGDVANQGGVAYNRIDENLRKQRAQTQQSLISRGLGGTSIVDTMQQGNERNAELERQNVDEYKARLSAGLKTQQAGASENMGAGIAGFIANRNDTAPSMSDYAGLIESAAAGNNGKAPAQRTGTVVNYPSGQTLGAAQSAYQNTRGVTSSVSGSSSGGQSYFGGMGSGGGGGSSAPAGGGYTPPSGPISAAGGLPAAPTPDQGAGGSNGPSPLMASAGTPVGTMSMQGGANNPMANNAQPYKGQVRSWMDFSGMSNKSLQDFINGGGKVTG